MKLPASLHRLIEELAKLPTIGRKSAKRLAFHLATAPKADPNALAQALLAAAMELRPCTQCGGIASGELCPLCNDKSRLEGSILVVEEARNVFTVEESGIYKGQYHVLGGAISPMKGIGPSQLNLKSLEARIDQGGIEELILATNPTLEGEATAHYLTDLFQSKVARITRIARGMPTGGDLEYADPGTLTRAIEGRTRFNSA